MVNIMQKFHLNYLLFFVIFGEAFLEKIPTNGYFKRHCKLMRKDTWARCSHTQYIPKLPKTVVNLMLTDNNFTHIQRSTFSNISSNRITSLVFRSNHIRRIDNDSFTDLNFLKCLEIKYEYKLKQSSLQSAFQSINTGIKTLHLTHNGWKRINRNMFIHLSESDIETLFLNKNRLQNLPLALFSNLSKLLKLDLEGNEIAYVEAVELHTLEKLDFSGNNLFLLPSFCHRISNASVFPRLKTLSLNNNAIRHIYQESFTCLKSLKTLILDGNLLDVLANNIFTELSNLETLSISKFCRLRRIGSNAFNISTLQKLIFTHNNFRFDRRKGKYDLHKIFSFVPNLHDLHLENNYLPKDEESLNTMLAPLRQLKQINLATTFIGIIPRVILQHNQQLEILNLEGNKINGWEPSMFENASSLKILQLDGNQIHLINKTSFPERFIKTIRTLNLANNPYWCTCGQRWFLEMLRSTNLTQKLTSWPHSYSCSYPERLRFTKISDYYPTDAECNPLNFAFLIIISVSSSVITLFIFIIITFGCQTNIKNGLYLLRVYRRLRSGYVKVQSQDEFEFDVFIVYSSVDRLWVHGKLLKKLENSGLKTCVHYRDFDPGEPITDNIEKYMAKCWKIIVVMSNEFAKSEWCQWEIDFVHERRRKIGKEALVLIMYRPIDSNHMTSRLRTLLSTTPHLTFKEGLGENLFWKAVVEDSKQPLSFPPIAM